METEQDAYICEKLLPSRKKQTNKKKTKWLDLTSSLCPALSAAKKEAQLLTFVKLMDTS